MNDQEIEQYLRAEYGAIEIPEKCPWCGGELRIGTNYDNDDDYFEYSYCNMCEWYIRHKEGDPTVIYVLEKYLELRGQ